MHRGSCGVQWNGGIVWEFGIVVCCREIKRARDREREREGEEKGRERRMGKRDEGDRERRGVGGERARKHTQIDR